MILDFFPRALSHVPQVYCTAILPVTYFHTGYHKNLIFTLPFCSALSCGVLEGQNMSMWDVIIMKTYYTLKTFMVYNIIHPTTDDFSGHGHCHLSYPGQLYVVVVGCLGWWLICR